MSIQLKRGVAILCTLATAACLAVATDTNAAVQAEPSQADLIRGQALNQIYGLGDYARPTTQERRAMRIRADALNRRYHLGRYAPPGSSFDWADAGIGASATLGTVLIAVAGAVVAVRRRRRLVELPL